MRRGNDRLKTERLPAGGCPIPLAGMIAIAALLFNLALRSKRQ